MSYKQIFYCLKYFMCQCLLHCRESKKGQSHTKHLNKWGVLRQMISHICTPNLVISIFSPLLYLSCPFSSSQDSHAYNYWHLDLQLAQEQQGLSALIRPSYLFHLSNYTDMRNTTYTLAFYSEVTHPTLSHSWWILSCPHLIRRHLTSDNQHYFFKQHFIYMDIFFLVTCSISVLYADTS